MKQGRVAALAARFGNKKASDVDVPVSAVPVARPASPVLGDVDDPAPDIVQKDERVEKGQVSLRFRQQTLTVAPPSISMGGGGNMTNNEDTESSPSLGSPQEQIDSAKLIGDWNVRGISASSGPFEYSLVLTAGIDEGCFLGSTELNLEVDGFIDEKVLTLFIKDEILMKTNTCTLTVGADHTNMEGIYENNQGGKGTITLLRPQGTQLCQVFSSINLFFFSSCRECICNYADDPDRHVGCDWL